MSPERPWTARFIMQSRDGLVDLLLAVDGDLVVGLSCGAFDEVGRLDEHAARPARRVEDAPVVRLDDLHDQLDHEWA